MSEFATNAPEAALDLARLASSARDHLIAADALIEAFPIAWKIMSPTKQTQYQEQVFAALMRANELYRCKSEDTFTDVLARREIPVEVRRLWAVSLLRIGAATSNFPPPGLLRNKTLDLAQETLPEMLKKAGVDGKGQSHENLERIFEQVRTIEDGIKALRDLGLDRVGTARNDFRRLIGSKATGLFLQSYLPRRIADSFAAFLTEVAGWAAEPAGWNVDQLDALDALRDEVVDQASTYDTRYVLLISQGAEALNQVVHRAFNASPAAKPPALTVRAADKKYPLTHPGTEIWFRFELENSGPGEAFDVSVEFEATGVRSSRDARFIGRVGSNSRRTIDISAQLVEPADVVIAEVQLSWRTATGIGGRLAETVELKAQESTIDWDTFEHEELYSSEPVRTTDELIGRATDLNGLYSRALGEQIASSYIWGQKRVGKTSIARTLETRIKQTSTKPTLVVYSEAGAFGQPTASGTIDRLSKTICEGILDRVPSLRDLAVPEPSGSLSAVIDFVDKARRLEPSLRVVVILDEFDEIPMSLYRRTPEAEHFFLALRSLSGLGCFGFVLVGGEKMEAVLNYQGQQLNKFKQFRVDYFDRLTQMRDFSELIRKPVEGYIEVSDAALEVLFDYTAGNPFFAKLVAQEMLSICVERRDAFVSEREMGLAAARCVENSGPNAFQHFWEDGIVEDGPKHEELSLARKRTLVALTPELEADGTFDPERVLNGKAVDIAPGTLGRIMADFERRGILERKEHRYRVRLRLFREWLQQGGAARLITSVNADDLESEKQAFLAAKQVSSKEILQLVQEWGVYKGKRIGEEHLRAWLNQFGDAEERRLAFDIARSVKFYQTAEVRSVLQDAYQFIERNSPGLRIVDTQSKRREFVLSYLNGPGKSGSMYSKQFASANGIRTENIVEFTSIGEFITNEPAAQVLVFMDDLIGSGGSLKRGLQELVDLHGQVLKDRKIRIFIMYVSGFLGAAQAEQERIAALDLDVRIHVLNPLTEADKLFSEESRRFGSTQRKTRAKDLAYLYGSKLSSEPLGHDDGQLALTFEHNCPNNALPIIWSSKGEWIPLFER